VKNTLEEPRKHGFKIKPYYVKWNAKEHASFKQNLKIGLGQQLNNHHDYLIFIKNTDEEPNIKWHDLSVFKIIRTLD